MHDTHAATNDARRPAASHLTRRSFLGSVAALATAPSVLQRTGLAAGQAGGPPIPVRSWNHMTLTVTDIGRSLEFYQGCSA